MNNIEMLKKMIKEEADNTRLQFLLACEYQRENRQDEAIPLLKGLLTGSDLSMAKEVMDKLSEIQQEEKQPNQEEPDDKELTVNGVVSKLRIIKGGNETAQEVASYQREDSPITFADVGGLTELKKAITMKIIQPFVDPALYRRFKKKSGGGILLYGPPGCGKTFIARATAGECKARFQAVRISDILDPYFGQSERNMSDIFSVARSQRPCILFFDEIDALGFNRTKIHSDMLKTVVDQLLSEIEGVDSNTEQILLIGATNMPWDVDPALRRPGRFDKTLFVAPPDEDARQVIFKLKLQGRPCEAIDYTRLARQTELYSGADIENVVEMAAESVLEEIMNSGNAERKITNDDLLLAVGRSTPSTLDWLRTIENFIKYSNQSGLYDEAALYLKKYKRFI